MDLLDLNEPVSNTPVTTQRSAGASHAGFGKVDTTDLWDSSPNPSSGTISPSAQPFKRASTGTKNPTSVAKAVPPTSPPAPPVPVASSIPEPLKAEYTDDSGSPAEVAFSAPIGGYACIEVEHRTVNVVDIKFEDDPFRAKLYNLMDGIDYETSIKKINLALKECRATQFDHALLAMGPAMLPLIPWALRQKMHKGQRREIMERCVNEFNSSHPELHMRWERKPVKRLIIMRKSDYNRRMKAGSRA